MSKQELLNQLVGWRHSLHQIPETAFEEVKTAKFVSGKLLEMGYEVETGVGKTGVVATLKVGDGDKIVGIRADMDAINVIEQNEFSYVLNI